MQSGNEKCANCGDNHTANYSGCPVIKEKLNEIHAKKLNEDHNQIVRMSSHTQVK